MSEIDLKNPSLYINRELSNIEFNRRVLEECENPEHPLLERVKFLAIFSGNMDEFFMVRVSGLKQQVLLGITDRPADGLTPREQLVAIHRAGTQLFAQATSYWLDMLQPALAEAGIHTLDYSQLKTRQQKKLAAYFEKEIFPVLTPLAFDPGHFPAYFQPQPQPGCGSARPGNGRNSFCPRQSTRYAPPAGAAQPARPR